MAVSSCAVLSSTFYLAALFEYGTMASFRTGVAAKSLLWLGHCFQHVHLRAVQQDGSRSAIAVRDGTAQCTSDRSSRLLSSVPGAHLSTLRNRPVDQWSTDVPAARRRRSVPTSGVLPGRARSGPNHIAFRCLLRLLPPCPALGSRGERASSKYQTGYLFP